jgi:hypothetical protein
MKRIFVVGLLAIVLATVLAALPGAEAMAAPIPDAAGRDTATLETTLSAIAPGTLSPEEAAGLAYMREEEKLAHDVYLTLYEQWGTNVFQNIARSEQTHTTAIKTLLDRYSLDDPAAGNGVGVFDDPDLQALYNTLVVQGSASLADAFKVGAAIEEIDILDLQERLAQTDNADIQRVYQNLENGSHNHLRAFVSNLGNQTGEVYQPQYLSQEAYDAIVNSNSGSGRGGNQGGQGQGRRRGRS